jgi:hypothetical protein
VCREGKGSGTKRRLIVEEYPSIPEKIIFDPFPENAASSPATILNYGGNDSLTLQARDMHHNCFREEVLA